MKVLKRNAVIVTVMLFVSVAVYLNWSYNQSGETGDVAGVTEDTTSVSAADEENSATKEQSAGLYYTGDEVNVVAEGEGDGSGDSELSEYFASVRLSRQQARYEATETLTAISETESASQEMIDDAINKIMTLADWTVLESELESIIIAKGFEECVVYISDGGVDVTVPAPVEGLSTAAVARITEVITGNTDFPASELHIIEIK